MSELPPEDTGAMPALGQETASLPPASALPAALAPCTPLIGRARSHGLQGRLGKRFLETRGRRAPCGGPTSSAQDAGQLCSAGVPSSHGHEGSPGGHLGLFNGLIANPNS